MGLFKFQNYSAIKNAQDNPRVRATKVTKNGYAFKVVDNDATSGYKEAALPFADAAEAKAEQVWVAMNIIDKPELLNSNDYQISVGEYIRAFNLNKMIGELVELTADLVTTAYASVAVGDLLAPVPAGVGEMKWVKIDPATDTGYGVVLKVTEKTPFGNYTVDKSTSGGFVARIASN